MTITCLFVQRKCRYPGEYAPELYAAVDEMTQEENPEYLQEKIEEVKKDSDIQDYRLFGVEVPMKVIFSAFDPTNLIASQVTLRPRDE